MPPEGESYNIRFPARRQARIDPDKFFSSYSVAPWVPEGLPIQRPNPSFAAHTPGLPFQ